MAYPCSDDPTHQSSTDDFCSICGAAIGGSVAGTLPVAGTRTQSRPGPDSSLNQKCNTCGIARIVGDVFCANCGTEHATGNLVMPEPSPLPAASGSGSQSSVISPANSSSCNATGAEPLPAPLISPAVQAITAHREAGQLMRAVLLVDRGPREGREAGAMPPADSTERVFILDRDVLPFGRTSGWMPIPDAGVSRSHGEFVKHADGYYGVRDVGSANGTCLNGSVLQGQEIRRIRSGDVISVGFWHLIKIE